MSGTSGAVVIIGAGHAGGSVAAMLRQNGWSGSVTLVGEEAVVPYQRPPLSKAWLKGEINLDGVLLRKAEFYPQQNIDLRTGVRAVAVNRAVRRVTLSDGAVLPYDALILATGARPRPLPVDGAELTGVAVLRTLADADALKEALAGACRLVVIGGGYIGLEVASAARASGVEVTVVEREQRLLARVASPEISAFYRSLHEQRGVSFVMSANVTALTGANGQVTAAHCDDGRILPADLVLVGIGAVPLSDLAASAGLVCGDGVVVDEGCRTNDPAIYAIGDVTCRPLALYHRHGRLESVQSALEQARIVAASLCGKPAPASEAPWFWSDQYEIKLQIAGLPFDVARRIVRGDPGAGKFAIFHLDEDDVIQTVESVNMAAEFMSGRQWIGQRKKLDAEILKDVSRPLKEAVL